MRVEIVPYSAQVMKGYCDLFINSTCHKSVKFDRVPELIFATLKAKLVEWQNEAEVDAEKANTAGNWNGKLEYWTWHDAYQRVLDLLDDPTPTTET